MHARVVTIQIKPDKREEAVRIYRESIVPAAKKQRGFRAAFLLTSSTGKDVSFTLWETEADLKASEQSEYFKEQLGKFTPIQTAEPSTEHYEVSVQAEVKEKELVR